MPDNRLERFAHNLDWNLLRTFVALVEEGSITAAANRLLLRQPAVSRASLLTGKPAPEEFKALALDPQTFSPLRFLS